MLRGSFGVARLPTSPSTHSELGPFIRYSVSRKREREVSIEPQTPQVGRISSRVSLELVMSRRAYHSRSIVRRGRPTVHKLGTERKEAPSGQEEPPGLGRRIGVTTPLTAASPCPGCPTQAAHRHAIYAPQYVRLLPSSRFGADERRGRTAEIATPSREGGRPKLEGQSFPYARHHSSHETQEYLRYYYG